MAFIQKFNSTFAFTQRGRGSVRLGDVVVTASTTGTHPHGANGIFGPRPLNATFGRVTFSFSKPINFFRLYISHVRSDEYLTGFNIGLPNRVDHSLIKNHRGVTTSQPYPQDNGFGHLIWDNLNTRSISFDLRSPGHAAAVLNSFSIGVKSNKKPTAVISGDVLDIEAGELVALSGARSHDPENDRLSHAWRVIEQPKGSNLGASRGVSYQFRSAIAGKYVVGLTVRDGKNTSDEVRQTINVEQKNQQPVVSLLGGGHGLVGQTLTPTQVSASDPDGDSLSYQWTLERPQDSEARLSDETAKAPTLVPDVAGKYKMSLVVSDGELKSHRRAVAWQVVQPNRPPIAHAGQSNEVAVGEFVWLDGSQSSDADGDNLTYKWRMVEKPFDSMAFLPNSTSAQTEFIPDAEGEYFIELIVNDGKNDSEPVEVIYEAVFDNTMPIAIVEPGHDAIVGTTITASSAGSTDYDGDDITYEWSLDTPVGSEATLSDVNAANPTFTPDVEGTYYATLRVNDGKQDSLFAGTSWMVEQVDDWSEEPAPIDNTLDGLVLMVEAEGGARKEHIILRNDANVPADLSDIVIHVPTAQKRAQKRSRYTFEQGFVLAAGEQVVVQVYPNDDADVRSFGSKLPILHDEKRCLVNVLQNDQVIASHLSEPLNPKPQDNDGSKPVTLSAWEKLLNFYKPFAFLATKGATTDEIAAWEKDQGVNLSDKVKAIVSEVGSFRLPSFEEFACAETALNELSGWRRLDQANLGLDPDGYWPDVVKDFDLPSKNLNDYVLIGMAGEYYGIFLHSASDQVYSYELNGYGATELGTLGNWIANHRIVNTIGEYPEVFYGAAEDPEVIEYDILPFQESHLENFGDAKTLAHWQQHQHQFAQMLGSLV